MYIFSANNVIFLSNSFIFNVNITINSLCLCRELHKGGKRSVITLRFPAKSQHSLSRSSWLLCKGDIWSTWLLSCLNANGAVRTSWCSGVWGARTLATVIYGQVTHSCWLQYSCCSYDSCQKLAIVVQDVGCFGIYCQEGTGPHGLANCQPDLPCLPNLAFILLDNVLCSW